MKQYISFLILMAFLGSQTVHAESGDITSEIALINESISSELELDSAPVPIANPNIYTPWELIHRSAMLSGFQWSGEIANFITPNMYIGTPFADSRQYIGQTNPLASFLVEDATTYRECLQNESYLSYGLGERIEKTDILELKVIAKTCAQQFYGTYFDGKTYTTREEYLMMLMTMFGEDVSVDGEFTEDGQFVAAGPGVESGFENVQANAWYSPYLAYADEIGILSTDEVKWQVARAITDQEAIDMLALYTAYRMGYTGDTVLDRGMIQTESLQYNIELVSENEVTIKVVTGGNTPVASVQNTTTNSSLVSTTTSTRYPGCDTDDIVLVNGQVWAACNVGASKAGTGVESYGSLFQWGRNVPFASTGSIATIAGPLSLAAANATSSFITTRGENWLKISDNNLWGGARTTLTGGIYSEGSIKDQKLMRGPCMEGYHVPTTKEWYGAISSLKNTIESVGTNLKIPNSGAYDFETGDIVGQGIGSPFWSSTPGNSDFSSYNIAISSGFYQGMYSPRRSYGYSVRCLKN